ncbi:sensor histidine kinase [Pseudonocardia sp. HH130630-07]|uniref:sensor histidine kinase n=1 Tax=Pseudonocardia sp. HH130630-07 TaxID=1690815 RepID=UPI000815021F|nr:histidine kinase [Pseudonocardia sp. HH130630-07]ANY07557.1 hypothetical protein AFB00_16070 [Pseudonocardia sp. HH130630-07]
MTTHPFSARFDRVLTACGLTGPLRRDVALAVVLAAVTAALIRTVTEALPVTVGATATALAVLQSLLLAVRRIAPATCLLLVAAVQTALPLLLPSDLTVRGIATAIAAYTCATLLPVRRVAVLVAAAGVAEIAGVLAAMTIAGSWPVVVLLSDVVSAAVALVGGALVGGSVATRRRYAELVRVRAAEVVAAQQSRADAAVRRERTRMARELHDIAAHHLSGMVVQAGVVEQLVERDPATARRTAAELRAQGRRTLRDLRTVVGTLREPGPGDGPETDAPVPGLADLDRLVERAAALGAPVVLQRHGPPAEPAPIADVTCHRVVQEALANAREHAPGAPVRVVVTSTAAHVTVEIRNGPALAPRPDGTADGDRGFGLVGMRERAHLVGAEFSAGPAADGGWEVRLVVPLEPGTEGDPT